MPTIKVEDDGSQADESAKDGRQELVVRKNPTDMTYAQKAWVATKDGAYTAGEYTFGIAGSALCFLLVQSYGPAPLSKAYLFFYPPKGTAVGFFSNKIYERVAAEFFLNYASFLGAYGGWNLGKLGFKYTLKAGKVVLYYGGKAVVWTYDHTLGSALEWIGLTKKKTHNEKEVPPTGHDAHDGEELPKPLPPKRRLSCPSNAEEFEEASRGTAENVLSKVANTLQAGRPGVWTEEPLTTSYKAQRRRRFSADDADALDCQVVTPVVVPRGDEFPSSTSARAAKLGR